MKVTDTLNDNVSVVWYGEYDAPFGVTGSKTVAGGGGKLSADGVGIETKNFYVDFKVPDSTWKVRTGIQGFAIGPYEDFLTDDDMAGISGAGMVGPVKLTLGWFKWDEGSSGSPVVSGLENKDCDFYSIQAEIKANEQLKFGGTVSLVDNRMDTAKNGTPGKTDDYYYGVWGDYRFGDYDVAGNFLMRNLSSQDNGVDGTAWMVNLYGNAVIPNGDVKLHFIYVPADDSATDFDRFSANQAVFELHNDNLMIFGTDVYYNNGTQGALAVYDGAYAGYGLVGFTVSGKLKLPQSFYAKYGAGYFMVADDNPDGAAKANDSSLGTEIAAQVGKKFADYYDLSLRGAYGFMGDYYKTATADAEDTYKVVAQLNVGF